LEAYDSALMAVSIVFINLFSTKMATVKNGLLPEVEAKGS
jgi:hypothetical protein